MNVSDFQSISYSPEKDLMYISVNENSVDMDDDDFKASQWEIIRQLKIYKPKRVLTDLRRLAFTVSIELQRWQGEVIAPEIAKTGVKLGAYIMPKEFFVHLGIELVVDELVEGVEKLDTPLLVRYFDDKASAEEWILHQSI
ncbi:MAG: hypothetical protein MUE85_20615 [Microscillaceae bacterium]|jgi:hypothetical protein|nr:hypothetical protein [Microscillaceae bacterium]